MGASRRVRELQCTGNAESVVWEEPFEPPALGIRHAFSVFQAVPGSARESVLRRAGHCSRPEQGSAALAGAIDGIGARRAVWQALPGREIAGLARDGATGITSSRVWVSARRADVSVAVGVEAGRAPVDAGTLVEILSRAGERSRARARRRVGIQMRACFANLRGGIRPRTHLARRLLHALAVGIEVQALPPVSEAAGSRLIMTFATGGTGGARKTLFLLCVSVGGSWARLRRDTVAVVEVELFAVRVRSTFGGETNTVAGASQFAGIAARADAGQQISKERSGSRALFSRDAILSFREIKARFAGDGTTVSILGAAQFASIAGCAGVVL